MSLKQDKILLATQYHGMTIAVEKPCWRSTSSILSSNEDLKTIFRNGYCHLACSAELFFFFFFSESSSACLGTGLDMFCADPDLAQFAKKLSKPFLFSAKAIPGSRPVRCVKFLRLSQASTQCVQLFNRQAES